MDHRLRAAHALAETQDGVISRRQLVALGVHRGMTSHQISSRRWRAHGRWTIATHTGDLSGRANLQRAVFELGATAAIDGVNSLILAGLSTITSADIHASVTQGQRAIEVAGVTRHAVRRRAVHEIITAGGIPRTRPEVAAIRAAQWAVSDRQAALFLLAPVQQRLLHPASLERAVELTPPKARRSLITTLIRDAADGVHSLGELDFSRECVLHGLPPLSRQVMRLTTRGTAYLDAGWDDIRLYVEIDGAQHFVGTAPVDDALRQNDVVINGDHILRIPLLGFRLRKAEFMAQVRRAHDEISRRHRSVAS